MPVIFTKDKLQQSHLYNDSKSRSKVVFFGFLRNLHGSAVEFLHNSGAEFALAKSSKMDDDRSIVVVIIQIL